MGLPGGTPSRTLYVDPAAIKAAQRANRIGTIVGVLVFGVPFLVAILIAAGPWAVKSCKGALRPFPIECGVNEEVEVSGSYEGTGPIVTNAGVNCKIHIKSSKLKATSFIANAPTNLEVTLENVQLETTETMFKAGSNAHIHLIGSTLVAQGEVIDADSNLELEITSSSLESKGGTAVKTKPNLKVHATAAKIRGKKAAFDTSSSFDLEMKKACEVTSTDGPAIRSTSGTKIEAEGGKIEGAGGAVVAESSLTIVATGLTISSAHEKAISTTSGIKLELTDSAVTSVKDSAIDVENGGEIILAGTTISGVIGIENKNGLKVKATRKSRIVGTTGCGIQGGNGLDVTLAEASIESTSAKALHATSNASFKLNAGARVASKVGAIETEGNGTINATGASIEGGTGPGISTGSNGSIFMKQGILKGNPAIQSTNALTVPPDLSSTKVEGAVVVVKRER